MTADPRDLSELLEESQDLQADALRPTHDALDELVELNHSTQDDDRAANVASTKSTSVHCARASERPPSSAPPAVSPWSA